MAGGRITSMGRGPDVAEAMGAVEASRLVTLTGGPAVGKSRLALEVAGRLADAGGLPARVVDLAPLADASSLVEAVADAVGTRRPDPTVGELTAHLRDRPSLLVLDNCEHLVAAAAAVVDDLLRGCPGLRILATSRERLRVTGEVVRRVPPPGLDALAEAGRHRSSEEAVAWSERLLSEAERVLLRRLSVFAAGFALDAARHVCAGGSVAPERVLDLLGRLVDRSLVETEPVAGHSRYRLPSIVRHHAGRRLGEAGEEERLRDRHAAWYAATVESAPGLGVDRLGHRSWLARAEADREDLRAAVDWAVRRRDVAMAARLARGQQLLWRLQGSYREARDALEQVLSVSDGAPASWRAGVLYDAGAVTAVLGDFAAARHHLEQSLVLFAAFSARGEASVRNLLAFVSIFVDDPRTSLQRVEAAIERARGAEDDLALSEALGVCGMARMFRGEAAEAASAFEESREAARRTGEEEQLAEGLVGAGWAALARGEFDEAARWLDEGLRLAIDLGDPYRRAVALGWLGELARLRGEADEARRRFEDSRDLAGAMGTPYPLARSLVGLGRLALDHGSAAAARAYLAEAVSVATTASLGPIVAGALEAEAELALAEGASEAAARFEEALAVAERCGDKRTVARCSSGLARAARRQGDADRARALHHQALAMHEEIGDHPGAVDALDALAGLALRQAGPHVCARLFGATDALRQSLGYARGRLVEEEYRADVAALATTVKTEELEAARAQGAAMTVAEAVSYISRGRGRRPKGAVGWDSLTSTEAEVAALAAEGLTNAEIGERLVMGRETVKTHLSTVLAKLGVRSRRQLAEAAQSRRNDGAPARSPGVGHGWPSGVHRVDSPTSDRSST